VELRDKVEYIHCDLSSFDSIRACADHILKNEKQLNAVMLNAGLMATPPSETKEGYEIQIGVNVLGHALLVELLFPLIETTPDARVVTLSSMASNSGRPLQKEMFSLSENYRPWQTYSNSKLADLFYAKALAKYFEKQDINARSIAAHPGGTASQLQINTRKMGGVGISGPFWVYVMKFFGMTIHKGALSQLMGILSDDVKNGDYIGPIGSPSAFKGDPKVIENYSVSEDNLEDFRTLIKNELSLTHL
jgi:protochlorophyllide reductase